MTARELDNQFEWTAHEPNALKEGVPPEVIEVIRRRKSTATLAATDATIIELGRQMFGEKKVASEVFARARNIFGDRALVELVLLMGSYSSIAALLTAFDVQLAPGQQQLLPRR